MGYRILCRFWVRSRGSSWWKPYAECTWFFKIFRGKSATTLLPVFLQACPHLQAIALPRSSQVRAGARFTYLNWYLLSQWLHNPPHQMLSPEELNTVSKIWDRPLNCNTDTFLTVTLGLCAEPGPVSQAASLWWALQRVARLAAKIDNAADWELLSKTDAVHRNAWISTQPRRIACARQISTWPFTLT